MDIDQAMLDPTSVFSKPDDIIRDQTLTKAQKIKLLRRWEYDARELAVADEENMSGGPPNMLDQVLEALHKLSAPVDLEHAPPTKHGGS